MESVINWDNILNNIYEQLKKTLRQAFQQENMHITSTNLESINKDLLYLKDEYNVEFLGRNTLRLYMDNDVDSIIYNIEKEELTKPVDGKVNLIEIEVNPKNSFYEN